MLTLRTVLEAVEPVSRYTVRTPLVPATSLADTGRQVRLKLETTQAIGAFKIRGAVNALSKLTGEQRARGVVCVSTGNHGRALASAAAQMGSRATVCMSSLVPRNKLEAIAALGADVRIHGKSQDEAQALVEELVDKQGMTEIPPFDHPDVLSGQGTIGLEICQDWPAVDTLIVPLSGGGLISGVALAAKAINPDIRVIAVSPRRGAAMAASLRAGRPTEVEELPTLADSLGGGIGLNNRYTLEHVSALVDEVVLLSERQIADAMRYLYFNEGLVTEGAGAVGAAVLIEQDIRERLADTLGKRIAIVVSGRNIDMQDFTQIVNKSHPVYSRNGEDGHA
ncbi:MAG: hydroxyectoine utilization dehydratase EutB [Gammaproteobacteria bacterium]|nr:hydroxyectoine utilization dehydratase EutB [Gammaproteobacteria bacterium]